MTITLTQIIILFLTTVGLSVLLLLIGVFLGYSLSRKTQGYRDVVEDQDITE
jgi:hypothetical protein